MQKVRPHLGSSELGWPCATREPRVARPAWAGLLRLGHTDWPCGLASHWIGPTWAEMDGEAFFLFITFINPFKSAVICKIHNKSNKSHKMTNPILLDSTQIVLHSEHIKSHALVQNNFP